MEVAVGQIHIYASPVLPFTFLDLCPSYYPVFASVKSVQVYLNLWRILFAKSLIIPIIKRTDYGPVICNGRPYPAQFIYGSHVPQKFYGIYKERLIARAQNAAHGLRSFASAGCQRIQSDGREIRIRRIDEKCQSLDILISISRRQSRILLYDVGKRFIL